MAATWRWLHMVRQERPAEMKRDGPSVERHADLTKRRAQLAAVHASLVFVESELLVEQVKRELDRSRFFRQELVAAREARRSSNRRADPDGWRS
jgi:hypothetical protein